jgi:hypothetical protein
MSDIRFGGPILRAERATGPSCAFASHLPLAQKAGSDVLRRLVRADNGPPGPSDPHISHHRDSPLLSRDSENTCSRCAPMSFQDLNKDVLSAFGTH